MNAEIMLTCLTAHHCNLYVHVYHNYQTSPRVLAAVQAMSYGRIRNKIFTVFI